MCYLGEKKICWITSPKYGMKRVTVNSYLFLSVVQTSSTSITEELVRKAVSQVSKPTGFCIFNGSHC